MKRKRAKQASARLPKTRKALQKLLDRKLFELARWRIWRARSKAAYERCLAQLEAAAASGIVEAWDDLFEVHRKAGRRKLAMQCALKVFELAKPDDAIWLAQECIWFDRFGTLREQRRRGFSPELGMRELLRRAEQGDVDAMAVLSTAYDFGGPIRRDARKSVLWLRRAAEAGDPDSLTGMGVRHIEGDGVRKSGTLAMGWYRKAAARRCPSATSNIGLCYLYGRGVPRDPRKAMLWFRKAARLGNRTAQARLADAAIDGTHVPKDPKRGLRELKKFAKRGQPLAIELLAERMIEGRGVPKDARRGKRMLARVFSENLEREKDFFAH